MAAAFVTRARITAWPLAFALCACGTGTPGTGHDVPADAPADLVSPDAGDLPCDGPSCTPDDGTDASDPSWDACPWECPKEVIEPGNVIVSEIMYAPRGVPDPDGDWIEVWNTTDWLIDIAGWTLTDEAGTVLVLGTPGVPLVVRSHAPLALAREADPAKNGGFVPGWAWGSALSLPDSGTLALARDGLVIDAVAWGTDRGFLPAVGASLNLSGDQMNGEVNDGVKAWCATSFYDEMPDGDFGTPGTDNQACCIKC